MGSSPGKPPVLGITAVTAESRRQELDTGHGATGWPAWVGAWLALCTSSEQTGLITELT